jgi:hypothetical protein
MNERKIRTDGLRCLAGIPKDPFRIRLQSNRADPFTVLELPGRYRLRVLRGQDRTVTIAQESPLARSGPKKPHFGTGAPALSLEAHGHGSIMTSSM